MVKKQKDSSFVIDNRNTYTLLNDFKSPEARNKMAAWQKNRIQLDKSRQQLQNLRDRYATGNDAQRQTLSQQILQLEAQCEKPKHIACGSQNHPQSGDTIPQEIIMFIF